MKGTPNLKPRSTAAYRGRAFINSPLNAPTAAPVKSSIDGIIFDSLFTEISGQLV